MAMSVNGGAWVKSTITNPYIAFVEQLSYSNSSVGFTGHIGEMKLFAHWLPDGRVQAELNSLATKFAVSIDATSFTDDINSGAAILADGATQASDRNYVTKPAIAKSTDGNYFWHVYRVSDNHSVDVDADQTLEISKVDMNGVVQAGYPKVVYTENPAGDNKDVYEGFPLAVNVDGTGEDSVLIVYSLYPSPITHYHIWLLPNGTFTSRVAIDHPTPADGNVYFVTDNLLIVGNTWYCLGYNDNGSLQRMSVLKTTTPATASSWTEVYTVQSVPQGNDYEECQWGYLANGKLLIMFRNNIETVPGTNENWGSIGRLVTSDIATFSDASVNYTVLSGLSRPSWNIAPDGTIGMLVRKQRDEQNAHFYTSTDAGLTWSQPTDFNPIGTKELYQRHMYGDVFHISKNGKNIWGVVSAHDFAFGNGCRIFYRRIEK